MKIKNVNIAGLKIIKTKMFFDNRGFFKEVFKNNLIKKNFKFDVMSSSKKNVIRGLHIQTKKPQAKVITVVLGKIMDVAVDLRKNSKTFGKYYSLIISDKSEYSFYIPEGFAHGFLCLSNKCIVHYKCSEYRHKESETTLDWRDQEVKIKWPIKKPILSKKDKIGKNLEFFR
ncbi:dTDP-4-dehydrorhamnose 3,5-epimerase [Candidatus Pelagibacter sp. RS39]|uniref:dTDP-4-dehydrorhamnose 3,5-epimerase n=1 Tax=Candidatus Pelagibacter sp. RS39 TaxID=1977864 RepID=UPI000A15D463|nr:dTDP-4-dehydrorhamnose 3,5-epimerase [Candidatus Pelagibacter sp. RS39]ARJ47394.1 dTDP-4-dehydrorhamnose 3,5-epimerase [Candidatus Pelagibacter sp. RS39]